MKLCYELLTADSDREARKLAILLATTYEIAIDVDALQRTPRKTKEKLADILDPSRPYTQGYRFIDYYPERLQGERKITQKFRDAEQISRRIDDAIEQYLLKVEQQSRVGHSDIDRDMVTELMCSYTMSRAFRCSVIDDETHLTVYEQLLKSVEGKLMDLPEMKRIMLETDKMHAFKEILRRTGLRIPYRVSYSHIKSFRHDSAHTNLNKWLDLLRRSAQLEDQSSEFPEILMAEFNELSKNLQDEVTKRSLIATAILSGFTSFLAVLNPAAVLAVISSLVGYVPLNYAFTKVAKRTDKNNFIFYFMDWREPPMRLN
jgi:hypothetical protein